MAARPIGWVGRYPAPRCSSRSLRETSLGTVERPAAPTPTELAWLAGFVDGEGTIYIQTARRPGGKVRFKGNLCVDNTDAANIDRVREVLSKLIGRVPKLAITNVNRGYRPCYSLRIQGQLNIALVLHALLPLLAGKRKRAELMLEFLASAPRSELRGLAGQRARTRDNGRWAPGYEPRHFAIVDELRQLNRRYSRGEWAARGSQSADTPPTTLARSD